MLKSLVPNLLTLSNLACGLLGILAILKGDFLTAAYLCGGSLIFDFMDGFAARALGVHSELGKQLDSLADMVSFGVVPGFLLFKLFGLAEFGAEPIPDFLKYLGLLVPLFSALRLAKFNIDERQSDYFIGMPTPANALFIFAVALTAVHSGNESLKAILLHPVLLTGLSIGTSILLVAELPLMSLKAKNVKWADNKGRIILLAIILLLVVTLRLRAALFIIPLYLILSLIFKPTSK